MPQALPAVAAWAATAWSSAVTATAVGLTKVGVMAAIGEGATIALAGKIVSTGAMIALSAGAAALMRPNTPSSGTTLDFKPDPKAPVRGAMGYTALGGNKVFQATWGYKKVAMSLGVALSLGPIDQITQFRADDSVVTFAGAQQEATGFYAADMWQRTTTGLPSDAALLPPTGLKYGTPGLTGWGSQHAAPGVSFAFWTMVLAKNPEDRDIFTNGVPDPRWVGRWMKVWDPRKDSTYPGGSGSQRRDDWRTWAWSENPYVHALAWARGHYKMNLDGSIDRSRRIAGIGAPDAAIDMVAFVEGMNVADANAWTISGEWSTSDSKFQTLVAMLQAGGGEPISRGAQISVMVNAPRVSTYTYTRDDLIGQAEVRPLTPRRDRKNTIVPRYRSEAHGWEYVPAGEVTAQVYRDEDRGEPRSLEIEYVHVRNAKQAGQLAAYDLANLREGLTATLPSKAHLMHVHPGDCITVDVPEVALAGQKFIVRRTTVNHQSASVTLELRAETDGKHAWALGQAAQPAPSPSLSAVDPKYVPPPPSEDWVVTPRPPSHDGTSQPVIVVEGIVDTGDVASVIIEYSLDPDGPWTVGYSGPPMADGRYELTGVEPTTEYWISVRYVARNGAISDRLVSGPFTSGPLLGDITLDGPNVQELLEGIEDTTTQIVTDATAGLTQAQANLDAALTDVQTRLNGVWGVVGETDEDGLRRTVIDLVENGTGLTELTTRVEGVEQVVNATGNQALVRQTDLTALETALDATYAKATSLADLTSRVTGAEGVNTAQNTRLGTVETDLAGKASATSVSDLTSTVNAKPNTFAQASAPSTSGRIVGDLWMDTDDNNQLYRWSGTAWAAVHDLRGEAAAAELAAARNGSASLSAQLGTMRQTVTDGLAGKANSSDLTTLQAEVTTARGGAASLNTRLNSVDAAVAGKASASSVTNLASSVSVRTRTFSQTSAPANPTGGYPLVAGDIWFDTDDNFQQYRWSGSAWAAQHDLRGETAYNEVVAARGGQANLNARFTQVNSTITDGLAGKASASSVTSLTTTVNGHTSSISTLQTTTSTLSGQVSAKFGVVLNAQGKIAGYQIANNGTTTTFDIQADKFRLTNGTTAVSPFVVSGSRISFTGNVDINGNLLVTGTIHNAKIQKDTITGLSAAFQAGAINLAGTAMTTLAEVWIDVEGTGTPVMIDFNAWVHLRHDPSGSFTSYFEVRRAASASDIGTQIVYHTVDGSGLQNDSFVGMLPFKIIDRPNAGSWRYYVRAWSSVSNMTVQQAKTRYMSATEYKTN